MFYWLFGEPFNQNVKERGKIGVGDTVVEENGGHFMTGIVMGM
jgi:hypothetical protein